MKRSLPARSLAGCLLLVLAAAACGPVDRDQTPEPPTTGAAVLRVTIDLLFRENVFLLALVTENLVTSQTAAYQGAAEALEENLLAIGNQFEKAYGDTSEKGFVAAWRPYTDLMAQYASRRARKLKLGKVDRAFTQVAGKIASFSATVTPLINARLMGGRVGELIASVRAAVDAQVAKDFAKAGAAWRTASQRASDVALVFSRAFADDLPALYPGDPMAPAAAFRSALEAGLTEQVYLLGMTSENIVTKQSGPRDGAKAALDAAIAALAKQAGAFYGAEAEKTFLALWKRRADLLIAYASAKDAPSKEKARNDLRQHASDAAGIVAGLSEDLDAAEIAQIVDRHGAAMIQAIDAQATGDFKQANRRLRAAAGEVEALGSALAAVTVDRFPTRFRSTPAGLPS